MTVAAKKQTKDEKDLGVVCEDEFEKRKEKQLKMMNKGDYVGMVRIGIVSQTPKDYYSDAKFNHAAAQLIRFAYYHDLWDNVHIHKRYKDQEFPTLLAMGIYLKRNFAHMKIWGEQVGPYIDRTNMSASEVEERTEKFLAEQKKKIRSYQEASKRPKENKYDKLFKKLAI